MKIVAISPNAESLRQLREQLDTLHHAVVFLEGGKSMMDEAARRESPDLMIVEGMCHDPQELVMAAQVTAGHPQMALVLLCTRSSPEFLMQAMRSGVREVLPAPARAPQLAEMVERIERRRGGVPGPQPGKVLAIQGCKGGCGATFLSANLAWQLAQSSRVLLVDLNLQSGDLLDILHEGQAPGNATDLCLSIERLDRALLATSTVPVSPQLALLAAGDDPGRALDVQPKQVASLLKLAVSQHDFVVVDLPRSLDRISLAVLDMAWRIYPVLQPQLSALGQAARLAGHLRALGYGAGKVEFILNRVARHSAIGPAQLRDALGDHALHLVPNDYRAVAASLDQGRPLAQTHPDHPAARAVASLAATLEPARASPPSLLDRLLRRA